MTQAQQTNQWPQLTALLDQEGGHISIGRMPPIEGAAIAVNDQMLLASLARREGELFPELLQRLDAAIGKPFRRAWSPMRSTADAPSSIRKKR